MEQYPKLQNTVFTPDELCRLLRDTDTKVEEIAHQVGYQDLSAFHRAFARRMSTAPAKYRTQHKIKSIDNRFSESWS